MRRNIIIVTVCVLIILAIPVFMHYMKDNPYSIKNRMLKETLSNFYDVYSKGMDGTSEFMKNYDAGRVKVKDNQKAYTDFITLEFVDNKWLISNYSSSSKERWPTLP